MSGDGRMMNYLLPAAYSKTYSSITTDVDLIADGEAAFTGVDASRFGPRKPARMLRCQTAGILQIEFANGVVDAIPVFAGEYLAPMLVAKILAAGTTVTGAVTAFW